MFGAAVPQVRRPFNEKGARFVRATVRKLTIVGLCAAGVLAVAPVADAFFPYGSYNPFLQLKLARWTWDMFNDVNNDSDISGPNEGLIVYITGGKGGFTDDEQTIVKEAFDVWQNVPTSYARFQFKGPIVDPLPAPTIGIDPTARTGLDNMNTISIQPGITITGIGSGVITDLGQSIGSVTAITFAITDTPLTIGNYTLWFTGGQIVEADIQVNSSSVRITTPGVKPLVDLKSAVVHGVGFMLGLSATPLNNLQMTTIAGVTGPVESPVVALRDVTNTLQLVGATPSMFPAAFFVDMGGGQYVTGNGDLAPDDIAGISYLYPRGSQDKFFTISHEARTKARSGIPSIPLPGAHVVAWCDVDNDPNTSCVPLFSTESGLYELQPLLGGRFDLNGLSKTMETIDGQTFAPTYTLTMSPLNLSDLERQSPPGSSPTLFASILGGAAGTAVAAPFDLFQSEVFHDSENIFDMAKHDLGTPLTFDRVRNNVVSADTGKILATMLPGEKPMFGDRNNVCPLNLMPGLTTTKTTEPPSLGSSLRSFRDGTLLRSMLGSMIVGTYYQIAPVAARFLLKHPTALNAWSNAMASVQWLLVNAKWIACVLAVFALGVWGWRRHRKAVAISSLIIVLGLMAMPAQALVAYLSDEDMVRLSDAIVTGKVTSVNSQWVSTAGGPAIVTDVVVTVEDVVKGTANKDGDIYLRLAGGRVGGIVTVISELPEFTENEEVILYLENDPQQGYVLVAGSRGKFSVQVSTTGKKYVTGASPQAKVAMLDTVNKQVATAADKQSGEKGKKLFSPDEPSIPLDQYKDYLRDIVKQQKARK